MVDSIHLNLLQKNKLRFVKIFLHHLYKFGLIQSYNSYCNLALFTIKIVKSDWYKIGEVIQKQFDKSK